MPIINGIIHHIDKKPDGSPSVLHLAETPLGPTEAASNLLTDLNEAYNAKPGKAWGLFHEESGAYPLSGWLKEYLVGGRDFTEFSRDAAQHLQRLLEEANLATGGHLFIAHYQQGMTDYLQVAVLRYTEAVAIDASLQAVPVRYLDLSQLHMAARINLSEWRNNPKSRQYISFIKAKTGRKATDYFRDFIGCQEGVDAPGETRTLLKAFSDFVEQGDLAEEQAREKTKTLVDYATTQAKLGSAITLEELSGLIDEDQPRAFFEFIRNRDYGLSPEIPPDKRTLNQFKRFTGRAEGLSISFEARLLGSSVEFDQGRDVLVIRNLPTQLKTQLRKAAPDAQSEQHSAELDSYAGVGDDPLLNEAIDFVRETRRASISAVQRKLAIGYNRAARLIEDMERLKVISPIRTDGFREVLAHA
ncbi:nucleoid-associated protein YejK [Pseudomonas otitidis]|uniref:Nucleoid-associated protein YejK n=1 Tax=Metapseudomonas otitidis TaxID=319939 RepID=A0A7X3KUN0_9GAMM|nr:nucleoid-associated protein YejK [Pseudomonas otitidis]